MGYPMFFEVVHQSSKSRARVGRIHTAHGIIETPNFVPVATNAAIKAVDSMYINPLDAQLMFCNTYHLLLHPGPEVVEQAGGLHKFMQREQPIITDSGGFQVFSLAYGGVANEIKSRGTKKQEGAILKISEEGVIFRSYRDGTHLLLTPESSVIAQKKLGADIIIPLDELPPYHLDHKKLVHSFERTHRWEQRSLETHKRDRRHQHMYAVVHGGVDEQLRLESCKRLLKLDFDGFAIGGSLGKDRKELAHISTYTAKQIDPAFPIHLLGVGDLESITACIPAGIDTFDSSYPTKCARHGILLHQDGPINITRSRWKNIFEPISNVYPTNQYSAAYLHHLFKAHEPIAHTLASIHNLDFMVRTMKQLRNQILNNEI